MHVMITAGRPQARRGELAGVQFDSEPSVNFNGQLDFALHPPPRPPRQRRGSVPLIDDPSTSRPPRSATTIDIILDIDISARTRALGAGDEEGHGARAGSVDLRGHVGERDAWDRGAKGF